MPFGLIDSPVPFVMDYRRPRLPMVITCVIIVKVGTALGFEPELRPDLAGAFSDYVLTSRSN